MVETTAQIETHIEATRQNLGANLDALEQKIKSATDWREYFQSSPLASVGVAFAGGVVLAMATGRRHARRGPRRATVTLAPASPRARGPHTQEVMSLLDNIGGALIGLAATRVRDLVAEVLPGFRDEFDRRQYSGAATGPDFTRSQAH
jgi:hypothetical protein